MTVAAGLAGARLEARGLVVRRGERVAVRGVDLTVQPGEIVAVLGPSGAGKSTLLDALSGHVVHGGTVALDGVEVGGLRSWQRARLGLGYVPQGPSVLGDLTVRGNVTTFSKLLGKRVDVRAVADEVGLASRLDVRARDLSGGERRRLELLRAFLAEPRVLLCDEPFTGLAPRDLPWVASLLRQRVAGSGRGGAGGGLSVIVSDHHVIEALALADRAVLLVDGAVHAEAAASAFLSHPDVIARYADASR